MRLSAVLLMLVVLSPGTLRAGETPAHAAREAVAKLQAMDLFPDLEIEGSELNRAVAAEVVRIERDDPAFFEQPGWPVFVARRVGSRLGVKPRTVAAIRASLAESFGAEPEEIQQLHGIQIVEAKFRTGTDWVDVLPQIAARVSPEGLVVDCDESLASTFADESQFERRIDEGDADYWKRQRGMLVAAADSRGGKAVLRVTFELHSECVSASVNEGERLGISDEGVVTISRIAPAARVVRAKNAGVKPETEGAGKKDGIPSRDKGDRAVKAAGGRAQPR